jgi:methionyl-tRNA formyltransferase
VIAVVTQPDRPAGRGLAMQPSAVKRRAAELGLAVLTPDRLDDAFVRSLATQQPRLLACVSYGKILPPSLLAIQGMTPLNVHPSLLPEYRGATPIQGALRDGRSRTGVSVIWMSAQMDAGDIALQRETEIGPDEEYGRLHERLAMLGAAMLRESADLVAAGALPRTPQDHARATYTKPLSKDDLHIDQKKSARNIVDLVRSASPSPGAWTIYDGKRLKVLEARSEPFESGAVTDHGPSLEASDGLVRLLRVVPEGKRAMSGAEFVRTRQPSK